MKNLLFKLKDRYHPDRKFRTARIWSNNELTKIAHHFHGDVINVSGHTDEDKKGRHYKDYFTKASSYSISNYSSEYRGFQGKDGELNIDLEKEISADLIQKYDVVFNHTTLEHIFDLNTAFKNLCKMSKDVVIVVVPFLQEMHYGEGFYDYWRFTPFALKRLFELNGLEMIYCVGEDTRNSSVYVLAVGSKHPQNWSGKLTLDKSVFINLGDRIIK